MRPVFDPKGQGFRRLSSASCSFEVESTLFKLSDERRTLTTTARKGEAFSLRPALIQVCSLNLALAADCSDYAAVGCQFLDFGFTRLEQCVGASTAEQVLKRLAEHDLWTLVASSQGGLFGPDPGSRSTAFELFHDRLRLCREIKIGALVVWWDASGLVKITGQRQVQQSLTEIANLADQADVRERETNE